MDSFPNCVGRREMTHKQNRAGNTAWKKLLALAAYALFVLSGRGGQSINGQAPVGAFAGQSDVGITPKAGSASFDDARHEYSITGGGENMWGTQDAFHFVWRRVSGDVTLTADVKLQGGGGNPHRKAGLMIRQGLAPSDPYADAMVHGDGLTSLQYRVKGGETTQEVRSPLSSPQSVRLERRGNTFTLLVASADREFKPVGSVAVALSDPVYVGLVVCSHDVNVLENAVFSNVEILSGPPPAGDDEAPPVESS